VPVTTMRSIIHPSLRRHLRDPRPVVASGIVLCIVAWSAHAADSASDDAESMDRAAVTAAEKERLSFAVVECFGRALEATGSNVDSVALLKERDALPADQRDSPRSLLGALAQGHGLAIREFRQMTLPEARRAPTPVFLLVKGTSGDSHAALPVLFDGMAGDRVRLFTGLGHGVSLSVGELASVWDGQAIALASDPALLAQITYREQVLHRAYMVLLPAGGLAGVIGLLGRFGSRLARPRSRRVKAWGFQAMVVLPCVVAAVVGVHTLLFGDSLGIAYAGRRISAQAFVDLYDAGMTVSREQVRDIDEQQVKQLLATDALLVDARGPAAYNEKRIKGSVGLPNFASSGVRLALAGIPKDKPLVVYCLFRACGKGRAAYHAIRKCGFTNVYHFPEGWSRLQHFKEFEFESGVERGTEQPEEGG
jgi:rhodanese-related sulfurtransferase